MGPRGKRVAVLAPPPLPGSGGHRTIYRNLNALAAAGFEVEVYVEGRRLRPGWLETARTRRWFGVSEGIEIVAGWPEEIHAADLVLATTWQSGLHLGGVETDAVKAHFVQDYECLFYPEDDERHALARSVHNLGFASIAIGNWLVEVLSRGHGLEAWPTPFSADLDLYGVDSSSPISRRRMVVANYQPEKPRRCHELMENTLQLVLKEDPSIEVVTFGSRKAPRLDGRHQHLGLVEPTSLAGLYREAAVGLSMSATNPSRVPFEMMAAGLPVVERGGDNTIFDIPEVGCLLADPGPEAVLRALQLVLDDQNRATSLGSGGAEFMEYRPGLVETSGFVDAVEAITAGDRPEVSAPVPEYRSPFVSV